MRTISNNVSAFFATLAPEFASRAVAAGSDPLAVGAFEQALTSESMRLRDIAATQTDDDFADQVAALCTPQAIADAANCQTITNRLAGGMANKSTSTSADKVKEYLVELGSFHGRHSRPMRRLQRADGYNYSAGAGSGG